MSFSSCFTDLDVLVVEVADFTNCCSASNVDFSNFSGRQSYLSKCAFLSHQLSSVTSGSYHLSALARLQFHVVNECIQRLTAAGFTRISEKENWERKVKPNGRYFYTRNETSVFAFAVGPEYQKGDGFAIVAAHTDSPSLKLKPVSKQENEGHMMVGVTCKTRCGKNCWTGASKRAWPPCLLRLRWTRMMRRSRTLPSPSVLS